MDIYILFRDIRTYGFSEDYYREGLDRSMSEQMLNICNSGRMVQKYERVLPENLYTLKCLTFFGGGVSVGSLGIDAAKEIPET